MKLLYRERESEGSGANKKLSFARKLGVLLRASYPGTTKRRLSFLVGRVPLSTGVADAVRFGAARDTSVLSLVTDSGRLHIWMER